ncbi:uncharacterized protein LOC117592124 [Drosophila guanche]|nr:uncharacterized protein LOC117592124 [Drosophila guanche]
MKTNKNNIENSKRLSVNNRLRKRENQSILRIQSYTYKCLNHNPSTEALT